MTLLKDLIEIPEKVGKGDFVFTLEDAVDHPEQVLKDYVVTPQLEECFSEALGQIGTSVDVQESRACYLHGSFGSGKSHFMAVLYLLLSHAAEARSVPELKRSVADHDRWLEGKNFLLIPVHMINANAEKIEEAVLAAYVERVRELHPEEPTPAVYRSSTLFANAAKLRETLGDDKFFEVLNEGRSASTSGLGDLAGPRWDSGSYETAVNGEPGTTDHDALVSALVSNLLTSFADVATGDEFVSLDDGLSVISKHAKDLGYDGLILFLDELILWLATRMADLSWVQREGQKMATLREAKAERPIPVTSFIARQRDLRDLVGDHFPGADKSSFHDALSYSEGRFHTVTLEDRNLRKIAEKRVLAPKNEEAKLAIDEAFNQTLKSSEQVVDVLLTDSASTDDFREVYPFSPAFIETLVAASSALQRERTAIRVMVQLLSDKRDQIELGDLIAVGDLFDVLRGSDEPFSPELKKQFKEAQELYESRLLPQICAQAGVTQQEDRDKAVLPPAAAAQDRFVKTMLLAALIPDAGPLRGLTVSRLVALNHGSLVTPIPGTEKSAALAGLRKLRGSIGQIKIQDGVSDPTVQIELSGIDTDAIINGAQSSYDNVAARRRFVTKFIRQELGITSDALFTRFMFEWHGISREIEIALENVRELGPDKAAAYGDDWKLVVDFPFDTEGTSPADDSARIEEFRGAMEASRTVFWLPGFFTSAVKRDLGKLVTIEALLVTPERLNQHTAHLSPTDQTRSRHILESQQSQLSSSLREALEQAYGISKPREDLIEDATEPSFESLMPEIDVRQPVGANVKAATESLAGQLLSHQYPASPVISDRVTASKINAVWELVRSAAEQEGGRLDNLDSSQRALLKSFADPLEIGQMHEGPFVLGSEWPQRFAKAMAGSQVDDPTVADLRTWINEPEPRGLTADLERLIILTYSAQTNLTFRSNGGPVTVNGPSDLNDSYQLVEVELPSENDWIRSVDRAAAIFGINVPNLRSSQNLTRYGQQIVDKAASWRTSVLDLKAKVEGNLNPTLGIKDETQRSTAISESSDLVTALVSSGADKAIQTLATAGFTSSPQDLAKTMSRAEITNAKLEDTNWTLLKAALDRGVQGVPEFAEAMAPLKAAAVESEFVASLSDALGAAEVVATTLLAEPIPEPKPNPAAGSESFSGVTVKKAREILDDINETSAVLIDITVRPRGPGQS